MKKKIFIGVLLVLIAVAGILAFLGNNIIYGEHVNRNGQDKIFYIDNSDNFDDVVSTLDSQKLIDSRSNFELVSRLMSYQKSVKPGRYKIQANSSYRSLISDLRSGNQDPVKLTINNVRTLDELAGKIARNVIIDSIEMLRFLESDTITNSYNITNDEKMTLFIPNTYQVYWNTSPKLLVDRLVKEHSKFWNEERSAKAKKLDLTTSEVYTLASIVDKESIQQDEKPRIAGVYLNRIEKGIPLQADPTVIFAVGDFTLRRVLNKHLEIDHPYNTYKNPGLPPGPIGMATISGIESVLDREEHDFLYFCAKPESNGEHAFAKTLSGHNRNAAIYRSWLNQRGIR